MKVIRIEPTPNPNAKKFILAGTIVAQPMSFLTAASAEGFDLAKRLFAVPGITSILFLGDFVTINKSSERPWTDITASVRKILQSE